MGQVHFDFRLLGGARRGRLAAHGVAIALGLLANAGFAQDRELTFAEAARLTMAQYPETRLLALDLQRADARIAQAGLRPARELSIAAEGFAGSGPFRGVEGAELTVSLASLFERGGKRESRTAVATAERALLQADQRAQLLDLLAETGRRYVLVGAATERLAIAEDALQASQFAVDQIRPRVAAAQTPRTELLDAEVRLSQAQVARSAAVRDLDSAQLTLAAQWSDLAARPRVRIDWALLPQPPAFAELETRLPTVPDLARFATATRLREAQLRLARSQAIADWRWSLGVRRYEGDSSQALVAGFSLPLGAARRNEAFEREAQIESDRIAPSAQVLELRLKSLLYGQLQHLANARSRALAIADTELPRAREAVALTERGYRIGRFPYRELAIVRAQLIELQLTRLEAAIQYHLTNIEIERLTGAYLSLLPEASK